MYKIDKDKLRLYRDYQYDRTLIYYKKEIEKSPRPYIDNSTELREILNKYKFTNTKRELDRASKFLINTVLKSDISEDNKALNCVLFRMINLPEAMGRFVKYPIDFDTVEQELEQYYEYEVISKLPVQSNAYFLSQLAKESNKLCKVDKYKYLNLSRIIYVLHYKDIILEAYHSEPKRAIELLYKLSGFGDFMSYQVWVDWTYMDEYKYDENYLVISGPGCNEGIMWLIYGESYADFKDDCIADFNDNHYNFYNFLEWFYHNIDRLMRENNIEWNPQKMFKDIDSPIKEWTKMNIENSFCEFGKLNRIIHNCRGRVRYY